MKIFVLPTAATLEKKMSVYNGMHTMNGEPERDTACGKAQLATDPELEPAPARAGQIQNVGEL